LVEKITGEPFQDTFTKEVWNKIGAESDASFLAYRYGIPLTHGGFLSNMRDMARFGLLFTPSYKVVSEDRIVTEKTLELLLDRPNPNLIRSDGSHNIYQWDYIDQDGFMIKGGWGGQALVVNPKLDIVAVYTSYFKDDYSQQNLRDPMLKVLRELYLKN
jgi:CubicO group peptidase (beta-lactamase class C family)